MSSGKPMSLSPVKPGPAATAAAVPARIIRFTRADWLNYLMYTASEQICASCWATQFKRYLDKCLVGKTIVLFEAPPIIMVKSLSTQSGLHNELP